ncbi:MAG: DMT family transporter, partial [Halieaceae bacterium]
MTANERRALKLGLSAVMLWSTVATAFSISLRYLTPLQLVTLASAVSWCFLSLRLVQPGRRQALRATDSRDRLFGLAMGWINPALYYLVLFAAYDRLPAQEAMAINYSWGITLALIAAPILGQKLSLYALLTSGISYFGILIIATRGELAALNFAQPEGVALALLSTIIWSLYWVINARKAIDPEV